MKIELNETERELLAAIAKRGHVKLTTRNLLHAWRLQNKGVVKVNEETMMISWHASK